MWISIVNRCLWLVFFFFLSISFTGTLTMIQTTAIKQLSHLVKFLFRICFLIPNFQMCMYKSVIHIDQSQKWLASHPYVLAVITKHYPWTNDSMFNILFTCYDSIQFFTHSRPVHWFMRFMFNMTTKNRH